MDSETNEFNLLSIVIINIATEIGLGAVSNVLCFIHSSQVEGLLRAVLRDEMIAWHKKRHDEGGQQQYMQQPPATNPPPDISR